MAAVGAMTPTTLAVTAEADRLSVPRDLRGIESPTLMPSVCARALETAISPVEAGRRPSVTFALAPGASRTKTWTSPAPFRSRNACSSI